MWFGFQFNLSDSSDDDFYRWSRSPVENDLYIPVAGIIFWCTKKNRAGGCLRVRPDTNADANRNKTKNPQKKYVVQLSMLFN